MKYKLSRLLNEMIMKATEHDYDTLSQAMNGLRDEGYTAQFECNEKGIRSVSSDQYYKPENLKITRQFRFEGMSNPADSSLLYALRSSDGTKGTLVMSYGSEHSHHLDQIIEIQEEDK